MGFAYVFVYRRFAPKPVFNSIIYHQALNYMKTNKTLKEKFGEKYFIMNCNGKLWSLKKKTDFDLIVFGDK